jgi:hypothetical protein
LRVVDFKEYAGFGVAGNFAHHLEQAGEMVDFVNVKTDEENAPKGIFPFYLPTFDTFLATFPLSSDTIKVPDSNSNLQVEPEVALICEVNYSGEKIDSVTPKYFTAYNDCSIRRPNAKKISEKKNWGENSKGISTDFIKIDKFEDGGIMDSYYISSFVKRDGKVYEYGKNSSVTTYNYFYKKLQNWIVDKLNNQEDFGPLENLSNYLQKIKQPTNIIISIGATSYSEFGEQNYLKEGDEVFVIVYDSNNYSYEKIQELVEIHNLEDLENISILHQVVK